MAIAILILLRGVFWLFAPPNPDEAYYWLWGQHLDFSYYDHPPLQVWLQALIMNSLGHSLFTLRSLNLITNSIFFYTYYQILKYLYGDRARQYFQWLGLVILASPLYNVMLALAWHDHLAIALSLVGAYLCIRFLDGYLDHHPQNVYLYGSAIALSLAHITKYNSLFMTLGILTAITTHSQLRKLWRDRRLWLAILIGAIGFLPVVYWNYRNNFLSFRFYSDRSLDSGTAIMRLLEPLGFIAISMIMLSPFVTWLLWRSFAQASTNQLTNPSTSLITRPTIYQHLSFWTFFTSTTILAIICLFSTALYYWNIHAYLLLFPLIPHAIHHLPQYPSRRWKFSNGLKIFGILFAALFTWNSCIFPVSALLNSEGDQDGRMLFGWQGMATAIRQVAEQEMFQDKNTTDPLIITSDYRSAAALAYAMSDPQVTALSSRISQFTIWNLERASQQTGKDAILIADAWYPLTRDVIAHFDQVMPLRDVAISRFGVPIKKYQIAIGRNYQP